jgi:eukaryotic-like serine/threonine-protein kinase
VESVGRYELQARIGQGAMAEVWRAHDPSIDRVLAIKLLKPEYRRDAEYTRRFLREAKAAGALAHPNIVTIYDVGEADGQPYIAMELLDGASLDQVLAKEQVLSDERVLAIAGQLASALSYAHLSGVIHRDIKPSNIMLGRDGRTIKLLDFGIARMNDVGREQERTQVGQVLGTPRYMSPEQALGQTVDGRSDLFSVGAVLYEMITGRPAFTGESPVTLALQITQQNPAPIASLSPRCPGGLRFIVDKLLAKRPERRFSDGADLGRAIEREARAYDAVRAEEAARGRYVPLQVRLTLAMVAVTAVALVIGISAVLGAQYRAMERMALSSGSSIAAFVASNAALPAVENAAAPDGERDWTPIQAFIAAASKDQSVRWMTMVDADGIIRGASDAKLLGTRYRAPPRETVVHIGPDVTVTDIKLDDGRSGFRFVHPIVYAGRRFGLIEISIGKTELQAAAATSRDWMLAFGALVLAIVASLSFVLAKLLAQPMRRLKAAMRDAAMGDLDFRISHRRRDEFGELFESFNLLATAMGERLEAAERPSGRPYAVEQTRLDAPVPQPAPGAAAFRRTG